MHTLISRIKHPSTMLVSVRSRAPKLYLGVDISASSEAKPHTLQVDKSKLESCIQMLHENEASILARSTDAHVQIKSIGKNEFELNLVTEQDGEVCTCVFSASNARVHQQQTGALHPTLQQLLLYAQRQVLPVYSTAYKVSQHIQDTLGSVLQQRDVEQTPACYTGADTTFMRSNACTVSKLVDMLNHSNCGQTFPPSFAARMAMLAATFCASAPSNPSGNLFHVSQLQMTDLPSSMADKVYATEPEKQHLTILMRGDSALDRIKRFNVAVRIFARDSELVREHLPKLTGMNSSIISGVMLVTGVRNRQAAAIFLSSETLTVNSHGLALQAFKQ